MSLLVWVGLAGVAMAIAGAAAIAASRRGSAEAMLLAVVCAFAAFTAMSLDAPDAALAFVALGGGGASLVALGAGLLTEARSREPALPKFAVGAIAFAAAVALAALRINAPAPAVEPPVEMSMGGFETLLALAVLVAAGFGIHALLGFGERASNHAGPDIKRGDP